MRIVARNTLRHLHCPDCNVQLNFHRGWIGSKLSSYMCPTCKEVFKEELPELTLEGARIPEKQRKIEDNIEKGYN